MNPKVNEILEEYKAQRRHRQARRTQYLRRFQVLRETFSRNPNAQTQKPTSQHGHQHHAHHGHEGHECDGHHHHDQKEHDHAHHHHHHEHQGHQCDGHHDHEDEEPQVSQEEIRQQEAKLLKENEGLKKELIAIESTQRDSLGAFKQQIQAIRNKYMQEIRKMTVSAKKNKEEMEAKIKKMAVQSEAAVAKNKEIKQMNDQIKNELGQANQVMGKYATEIKQEYSQKIKEFQKIFNASNEKIESLQKQFNQGQFIENTLKNDDLLKNIEQNAQRASEAGQLLQDYKTLLQGKKQILQEIRSNNEMKEKEIEKMTQLQGKMKTIVDRLNQQKQIYVKQNNTMAQQLIEIKNLLMGVMNEGPSK